MSDRNDDEQLADVAEELAGELRRLREELDEDRTEPPRGPLGLPRPPSPREFMEFADEVAIPGLIAILEANIKLLEALQKAIRLADSERRAREKGSEAADKASEVGQTALERLEDGLDDLRGALEGDSVSEDRVGSDLLDDIDRLQAEIDERLDSAQKERSRAENPERNGHDESASEGDEAPEEEQGDDVNVDVDAELESLRKRYDKDDEDEDDEE